MESLVLVGGAGSRLRGVIGADLPKPMAPIGGRPFLAWLLDQLRDAGCRDVWLLTGHRGEVIERYVGAGDGLGPAGALLAGAEAAGHRAARCGMALPRLSAETCLVMNGDSYLAAPLPRPHRGARSMAPVPSPWHSRACRTPAGTARWRWNVGRVVSAFREKEDPPRCHDPGSSMPGVLVMDTAVLASHPADRPVSLEQEVLPALMDGRVRGEVFDVPFVDIGVPESYAALDADPGAVLPEPGP